MSAEEASIPWNSPKLRAILACTLVLPLGVALVSPVLPVIRDSFVISDARTSLLITLYFLPGVVLSPVIGLLADRYGRRHVIIPSIVAFGLTGGVIAFMENFTVILTLRMIQGIAATGVFILTVTFISDVFDGLQRNAVLGVNASILFAAAAIYPFVGGALASVEWHLPFFAYFVALPIALYASSRLDDPPNVAPRCGPGYVRGAVEALPPIEAGALYGATFLLEVIAFGAILTVLPFVLLRDLAASPVVAGGVITVMTAAAALVSSKNGSYARHYSNHRLLAISFCCYGLGLLVTWTAHSIAVVMIGVAVFGAGFGLVLPSVDAEIARLTPPEYRAGALSIRNGTTFLGRSVGPVTFTSTAIVTGYQPLLLASGLAALSIGAVALVVSDGKSPLGERSVSS